MFIHSKNNMPPKVVKQETKPPTVQNSSSFIDSEDSFVSLRNASLYIKLIGDPPGQGEWGFLALFDGAVLLEGKWSNGLILKAETLPIDLKDPYNHVRLADKPLIFLLRLSGGKSGKDPDPLLHIDNRAGATLDLFPLVLGEQEIFVKVPLNWITTGKSTGCRVQVHSVSNGNSYNDKIPLLLTMISAHCLPLAKEGTVYLSAIGMNEVIDPIAVRFGMSLSSPEAKKLVWATVSNAGQAANSQYNVPYEDKYIPQNVNPQDTILCRSFYWNAMKRVLVDPDLLRQRLVRPFFIEIAGVPKMGKVDVRGRYMGIVDAGVLLEPGQHGVTTCAKLLFFNEAAISEHGPLLDLPATSAKASARPETSECVMDEHQHCAYVVLRFDLTDPLISKAKMATLYETIGFPPPEGPSAPVDLLDIESPSEDIVIDATRIKNEGGALAVHKELSSLACRGAIPMNQGIKRTAANRLLMRVRAVLKQFPPGECSNIEWQEIVTGQHAACRRAVTASFAPQPPTFHLAGKFAAARSRMAGNDKIAEKHVQLNLKNAGRHPRQLLSKVLRCLEEQNDSDAKNYLLEGLSAHIRNRYLLLILGGLDFYKEGDSLAVASAAFRISVKGDCSDGTTNAICWAGFHAFNHHNGNHYAAFIAAKKMRKSYSLPNQWKKFLQRWVDASGEEEIFWIPADVSIDNPMLIAAAFFLCLRCFKFSERLLQCIEEGCGARGSDRVECKVTADMYYIRAASLVIRRQIDEAMEVTLEGLNKYGPSAILCQIRAVCLLCIQGWDGECENALKEAECFGSEPCPAMLIKAAIGGLKSNPQASLQRAARAHKLAPSAHSALIISRVYAKTGEEGLAERWAACAVKIEPLLADGWAMLALLALYDKNLGKARMMLRTARQVGPISTDIEEEVKKVMDIVQIETLPDLLVKNLCYCNYNDECSSST